MQTHAVRGHVVALGAINDEGRSWVELIPAVADDRNGPWHFTITDSDLEAYAQSLRDRPNQVPVDYDHEGDEGGSTRAAGWFTGQAQVVAAGQEAPDGSTPDHAAVWAEVQWTQRAVGEIRDGQYRFTSPVFTFQKRDPGTGLMTVAKEIVASTLTNRPHFKQMAAVTAADVVWAPDEGLEALREALYAELNPGGPEHARYWVMDVAPGKALVREYDSQTTWVVPFTRDPSGAIALSPRGDWQAAEEQWVTAAQNALKSNRATRPFVPKEKLMIETPVLAKTLGLAEDATDEQVAEALKTVAANAAKAEELTVKVAELEAAKAEGDTQDAKIAELEQKLADQASERETEKITAALEQAVREGRIVPASKDTLAEQFTGNLAGLEAVLASMPVRKGLVGVSGTDPDGTVTGAQLPADVVRSGDPVLGADLDAKAMEILAAAGKDASDQDAYLDALVQAEQQLGARNADGRIVVA